MSGCFCSSGNNNINLQSKINVHSDQSQNIYIYIYIYFLIDSETYLSVFSPNAGKCGPEELQTRTLFMQCIVELFC